MLLSLEILQTQQNKSVFKWGVWSFDCLFVYIFLIEILCEYVNKMVEWVLAFFQQETLFLRIMKYLKCKQGVEHLKV